MSGSPTQAEDLAAAYADAWEAWAADEADAWELTVADGITPD